MANFPTLEKLFQEIHFALDLPQKDTKRRFENRELTLKTHQEYFNELFNQVCAQIDFDQEAQAALKQNIEQLIPAYQGLYTKTWTYQANQKQVIWHLLAYFFAPGIARHIAFWNLNISSKLDKGMPRHRFWYLPNYLNTKKEQQLYMPVPQVLDWLQDLLGTQDNKPAYKKIVDAYASWKKLTQVKDIENKERLLRKWLNENVLPSTEEITELFRDEVKLEFSGVFELDNKLNLDEQFKQALSFIESKQLPDEDYYLELGIEKIEIEKRKQEFIELVTERYQKPDNKTIRDRLIMVKMLQAGYLKLNKFLFPEANHYSSDPVENKLLQIIDIYKNIHAFTVEAWNQEGRLDDVDTLTLENSVFENLLESFPILELDAITLYVSILPSYIQRGKNITSCADILNFMFKKAKKNLADMIFLGDVKNQGNNYFQRYDFANEYISNAKAYERIVDKFSCYPAKKVIAETANIELLKQLYLELDNIEIKKLIWKRLENIVRTDREKIELFGFQLEQLLNNPPQLWIKNIQQTVENILAKTKYNAEFEFYEPFILQFEAKHLLNQDKWKEATEKFKQAFDSDNVHCGRIKAEAARDYIACKLKLGEKVSQHQYEKYFREVLNVDFPFNADNFEGFKNYCERYFDNELYHPYLTQ